MIDWWDIFINGLWILGLAIVLAAFSYRSAWKTYQPKSGAMLWAEDIWPALGLAMFCFGLGLNQRPNLEAGRVDCFGNDLAWHALVQ